MTRVLIVCTGNTCRSPMAEAMLRSLTEERGLDVEVRSAGVSTVDGLPVSPNAAETLRKRGVKKPSGSTSLTGEGTKWADLILTMTAGHKRAVLEKYPEAEVKTFTLKEFALKDDPVMDDLAEAERLFAEYQTRRALGKELPQEDRERLAELQRRLPSFDIADPYGGPLEVYERCAEEIMDALKRSVDKLRTND
ncbi:low molecular weight protein arginine phosphatase [Cohnella thailandensis]|uniref:Low molecular weight protein arginine phosphatase n=1 Tax=Cohnella thailandensis TaxID=557557 RepID=A0A841T884_9BACL|nr:low molecular weight protein arginine phosphatase [Cohnella thailandensis]MBB6638057.1 low molecular weight protein arginine phosphatase [Cohnella thailandensis]MBP1972017.1 protein-tyrosine phosphatase [Cohnella thailandensis]